FQAKAGIRAFHVTGVQTCALPIYLAPVPFLATVRDTVSIRVRELPDAGRARDIDGTVVPQAALGEHDPLGEHGGPVEAAVAVRRSEERRVGKSAERVVRCIIKRLK